MALSIGFGNSVSLLPAIQATRLLTFASVGLSPTEHTCFFLVALPYGGFSPVRLQGRSIRQGLPVRHLLASDGLPLSFVLPASLVRSPFCAGGRCALEHLRSSGRCRSTPGALAPDRVVLSRSILTCGPIRPTRRHIPISPLSGLYEMPSLCTLRLGDLRVVPRFRCLSFLTCRPLRLRGDR
jgi:hypothetical protein